MKGESQSSKLERTKGSGQRTREIEKREALGLGRTKELVIEAALDLRRASHRGEKRK